MSTELLARTDESLPDHVAFGLADSATSDIDSYVADVNERLDEVVPDFEIETDVIELVAEALPYELSEAALAQIDRQERRLRVIAEQQRKRQFGRPVLSFASISYPKREY